MRNIADETIVWRYMSFLGFIELLETATLWFSRADLLDDPREGTFTNLERRQLLDAGTVGEHNIRVFEHCRHDCFVSCWTEHVESMAMWELYGRSLGKVAVKSTVGQLKEAVSTCEKPVHISKIQYIDWSSAPWNNNLIGMLVRKILSYKHEGEIRLLIWAPGLGTMPSGFVHIGNLAEVLGRVLEKQTPFSTFTARDMSRALERAVENWMEERQLENTPNRFPVKVNLSTLFNEVIVGPNQWESILDLFQAVMTRYGLPQTVRWSELA